MKNYFAWWAYDTHDTALKCDQSALAVLITENQ